MTNRLFAYVAGLVALTALAATLLSPGSPAIAINWQQKVDPWVLASATDGETEFLVYLTEQADLSAAAELRTRGEKGRFVYERLTAAAEGTQGPVIAVLDSLGAAYRPYWVANMIWVRGDMAVIQTLARRADVAHLYANPAVRLAPPLPAAAPPAAIEWGVLKVRAPELWALGITGQGVVVGGQDTGYEWSHPALQSQYRGWNGITADHNYNWHDAIHSGGGVCGPDSPFPCDDHNHGTHTMGTMVGDDGGSNQIGVAPGAKWIGCRNMNQGWGTPASYAECYQWFIAPTDLNGQNPDPSQAPDIVNNSWSCPEAEGCTDPNVLLTVVDNVRAAGILTVHSAGNSGSGCSSINTPAAIYDASFTVGATDSGDVIAGFSSRGPVTVDGSNRLKPDISAPGVGVRSSIRGGGYSSMSGTSMAAPHTVGVAALILSAAPHLKGDVAALEALLAQTAVPRTTTQVCGGIPGSEIPNNTYGYGRIDALNAYNNLAWSHDLSLSKSASAASVYPGELLTYTLTVSHSHPYSATTNVVLTDTVPAGTAFVTATLPVAFDGTAVTWLTPLLDNESLTVQLVVRVTAGSGVIANDDYGVRSDDVAYTAGAPVETAVVPRTQLYFPLVRAP